MRTVTYFVTLRGAVIISRRGAVFRDARGERTARGARGVCGAVFRDTAFSQTPWTEKFCYGQPPVLSTGQQLTVDGCYS